MLCVFFLFFEGAEAVPTERPSRVRGGRGAPGAARYRVRDESAARPDASSATRRASSRLDTRLLIRLQLSLKIVVHIFECSVLR